MAKLLDAAAESSAGTELPRSHREQSPVNGGLARDATPVPTAKRQLDATLESDPLPAKRARLTRTDAQQPGVEKVEQTDKRLIEEIAQTTLQQPEPRPPKRLYASFLKDFVDPVHPHPRPESLHTFVSGWLESVGSDREKRCRSGGHLHPDDDPVPRQLARSAPEMGSTQDTDGFAVPATPSSTRSRRVDPGDDRSRSSAFSTAGARNPLYRLTSLQFNNVEVRDSFSELPDHIHSRVQEVRAERKSPGPSSDQVHQYMRRLESLSRGCKESEVAAFLNDTVFPNTASDTTYGPSTGLASSTGILMSQHLVPAAPASPYRITQPKPDLLYGYSGQPADRAFTQSQFLAQTMLHPRNPGYPTATTSGLSFPFFAIEFKAAGGTGGDLWVATNQCAGASAACLNAVGQLNTSLREYGAQGADNLSYSIAVDNNLAQLYISWKEGDLNYFLQRVDVFLLSSPEHFKNFRRQVRNILDWGKDARLKQIGDALDVILEENRKRASEAAKARPPPSDGSAVGGKKQDSSSRRNSSRSDNSQAQTCAADGPYRSLDETTSQDVCAQHSRSHQQQSFVDADDYTSQDAGEHGHRSSSHRHQSNGPPRPSYAPTPPRLSGERRKSTRSSPSRDDSANSIVQKHSRSSHGTIAEYWEWHATERKYFHQHTDGSITWAEDE